MRKYGDIMEGCGNDHLKPDARVSQMAPIPENQEYRSNGTAEYITYAQSGYLGGAAVEEFVDSLLGPDGRFNVFASGFLDSMSAGAKVYTPRDRAKSSVNIWDPDGLGYDSEEELIRLRRNQPLEDTQSEEEFRVSPAISEPVWLEEPTESYVNPFEHLAAAVGPSCPYDSGSCSYDAGSEGSVASVVSVAVLQTARLQSAGFALVPPRKDAVRINLCGRPFTSASPVPLVASSSPGRPSGKELFLAAYGGGLFADSRRNVPGFVCDEGENNFIARRLEPLDSPRTPSPSV